MPADLLVIRSVLRGLVALVEESGLRLDAEASSLIGVARNTIMNLELQERIAAEASNREPAGRRSDAQRAGAAAASAPQALPSPDDVYRKRAAIVAASAAGIRPDRRPGAGA